MAKRIGEKRELEFVGIMRDSGNYILGFMSVAITKTTLRASSQAANPCAPLAGCRVVLVGPGRVGCSFGHWLMALGATLVAVSGRRRTVEVESLLAAGAEWRPLTEVCSADADVLLLAVADPALASVAEGLAERPQARVALHVSGHFDSTVLAPLAATSTAVGSLHPLRAFTAVSRDFRDARGVTFAYDGSAEAIRWARLFAANLGGHAVELTGERRVLYHLAATLAAGGVVTVLHAVGEILRSACDDTGCDDTACDDEVTVAQLLDGCLHLTRGAFEQLPDARVSFASAITGPAARGDEGTLERQRCALKKTRPELVPLFEALADLAARGRGLKP